MITVVTWITVLLIAALSAVFGSNFREWYYQKLTSDADTLNSRKEFRVISNYKSAVILGAVYLLFAVFYTIFCLNKERILLTIIENQVVWNAFLLTAVIDFQKKKIPNQLIVFLLIVRAIMLIVTLLIAPKEIKYILLSSLIGFFAGGFIILACMLISRGGVGAGDVKLFAVSGLFFGFDGVLKIMMYSLFLAAVVSIILLLFRKAKMKSTLAMAPFIFLGLTLQLFFS